MTGKLAKEFAIRLSLRDLGMTSVVALALLGGIGAASVVLVGTGTSSAAIPPAEEDAAIAKSLATMLRAGRTVIGNNQAKINDPALGDKGLDGKAVLAEAVKIYKTASGVDPASIDPASRHGKLLRMEMDAIAEVLDNHQATINRRGVGFKGFIPAVFGRQVSEAFGRRATGLAEIKVTAPKNLVRNQRARADDWESTVIGDKLMSSAWPKDQVFSEVAQIKGKMAYRTAMPEYYAAGCLSCHGLPAGEIDITGYPKEGAQAGDLGGVISIALYR